MQRWMSELSVLWLLLLGVFLVVLSSAVLAASQWQRVSAVGQYGLLLFYTLLFGGSGVWIGQRRSLPLTSQALQIVALLLVPVNVIALDQFALWTQPWGIPVMAIALPILAGITFFLMRRLGIASLPRSVGHYLVLSGLQLGWHHWGFFALYSGVGLTLGLTIWRASIVPSRLTRNFSRYGLGLLILRSLGVHGVLIGSLGLAVGLLGIIIALDARLGVAPVASNPVDELVSPSPSRRLSDATLADLLAGSLLVLGWLLSVTEVVWQAIAISGLALWFFGDRLRRYHSMADFATVFVVGLQAHWLVWRWLPLSLRQSWVEQLTTWTHTTTTPWALLSVVLLPDLLVTVLLALRQPPRLRLFGTWLVFVFASVLTGLSLYSDSLRSLNWGVYAGVLGWVWMQYPRGDRPRVAQGLVYGTHILGLLTLLSVLDWGKLPTTVTDWALILLGLGLVEWGVFWGKAGGTSSWHASSYPIGAGLIWGSYLLFHGNNWLVWVSDPGYAAESLSLGGLNQAAWWLLVPVSLLILGIRLTDARRLQALNGCLVTVAMSQLLTLPLADWRLAGVAIATLVMASTTVFAPTTGNAIQTVGYGLCCVTVILNQGWGSVEGLVGQQWALAGAIALWGSWLLRDGCTRWQYPLIQVYVPAFQLWGMVLAVLQLLGLSAHAAGLWDDLTQPTWMIVSAAGLLVGAIAYRYRHTQPRGVLFGLAWAVELLMLEAIALQGWLISGFAWGNVGLGLLALLLGEHRRHQSETNSPAPLPWEWHWIPLVYALLTIFGRLAQLTSAWSWLHILGVAVIGFGIGRRLPQLRWASYLGFAGCTLAVYDAAFFYLPDPLGGDRLLWLAALTTGLTLVYRVGFPQLAAWLQLRPQTIRWCAHLHWGLGSYWLLISLGSPTRLSDWFPLAIALVLTGYALFQGRDSQRSAEGFWVYVGVFEGLAVVLYLFVEVLPPGVRALWFPWCGAIATIAAVFMAIAPWQPWGWNPQPWHRSANVLPIATILLTAWIVHPGSLLVAAMGYGLFAHLRQQIRLSYLSILLANWAIALWVNELNLAQSMTYATLTGLSLLYIAQVDPLLQSDNQRQGRHWLRCIGTGIICLAALLIYRQTGLVPGVISLAIALVGISLRVRAYLYIGTLVFMLNATYQLLVFVTTFPLLKWGVGLLVGIGLIWIAATFETRRDQLQTLLRDWWSDLREWS
jgi:hypothetical protein